MFLERLTLVKAFIFRPARAVCAVGLVAASWSSMPASAHLGGDASSVDADRQMFHAQLSSVAMPLYLQHEIRTQSGTLLHEYATPAGRVFAVSWRGALPPDLHQLFGNYYPRLQSAAPASVRPGMHRQLTITAPDLVVQATARTRAYQGTAYIPGLVPAGVSVSDLP
jgi:hypothetical protein